MIGGGLESHSSASTSTHDVQHDVVAQAGGAVDADQDPVFDGGAEAHGQPVRPCAWPLIIGPGVGDQAPSLPKDVGGARCGDREGKASFTVVKINQEAEKQKHLEEEGKSGFMMCKHP